MEQSFNLNPKELQSLSQMEQENLRLNATYGLLCRQKEDIDKKIAISEEAQRSFIRSTLRDHGVEQFLSARIEPGRIICTLADDLAMLAPQRPNGELRDAAES